MDVHLPITSEDPGDDLVLNESEEGVISNELQEMDAIDNDCSNLMFPHTAKTKQSTEEMQLRKRQKRGKNNNGNTSVFLNSLSFN